jgi:hypothetical protein
VARPKPLLPALAAKIGLGRAVTRGSIGVSLEDCEQNMISNYAMAVFLARKYDIVNPFVP